MRERLVPFGGRLDIRSTPGQGATLLAVIPRGPSEPRPTPDPAPRQGDAMIQIVLADDHIIV